MAPASCERAGEKFNHPTIPPPYGHLSPVEMRASERTERSKVRAARCPVPRLGVVSGPPHHQPEHAPRTDPRLR
eukprot:3443147-Pleurochrysis_carterae.AAC.1